MASISTVVVPRVKDLSSVNPTQTRYMRRAGAPPLDATHAWTPLTDIAPALVSALVRSEDPRFFDHHGVDWRALRVLLRQAVRTGRLAGGASTITMQLARNLYLAPARSIVRKVREIHLATRIDRTLPKGRILELYLNLVEWGPGIWGCAAASDYYFGKTPRALDLFESTLLVTLLPAPKSGLSGRLAARSRQVQLSVSHQLLLSGQASAEACAVCSARVRELHRLLGDGMPLLAALDQSAHVRAAADAEFISDLIADLRVEPMPPDQMLTSRCAERFQQQAAFERLVARFGPEPLSDVLSTGSYAALMNHPAAPQPHAERL